MSVSRKVMIVLLGAAITAPGYGQQPVSSEDVVVVGRVHSDQKLVCKRQKNTGTRFEKKTCRTVQQWDQLREQHRRDAEEIINAPQINTQRGG